MSLDPGCRSPWGPGEEREELGGVTDQQEQPQGLEFPTPGVVFVIWITFSPHWDLSGSVTDMASDKRAPIVPLNQCRLD